MARITILALFLQEVVHPCLPDAARAAGDLPAGGRDRDDAGAHRGGAGGGAAVGARHGGARHPAGARAGPSPAGLPREPPQPPEKSI